LSGRFVERAFLPLGVNSFVLGQLSLLLEALAAHRALEGLGTRVSPQVVQHVALFVERFLTHPADQYRIQPLSLTILDFTTVVLLSVMP